MSLKFFSEFVLLEFSNYLVIDTYGLKTTIGYLAIIFVVLIAQQERYSHFYGVIFIDTVQLMMISSLQRMTMKMNLVKIKN